VLSRRAAQIGARATRQAAGVREQAELDRPAADWAAKEAARFSAAVHEASHATVGEALGYRTGRIRIGARGEGGYRRAANGRVGPTPAAVLIAGQLGAAMFAEREPCCRLRNETDNEAVREATGGRRDLRAAAEQEARTILQIHRATVLAVAKRLLSAWSLEDAELDVLLVEPRIWFLDRAGR